MLSKNKKSYNFNNRLIKKLIILKKRILLILKIVRKIKILIIVALLKMSSIKCFLKE